MAPLKPFLSGKTLGVALLAGFISLSLFPGPTVQAESSLSKVGRFFENQEQPRSYMMTCRGGGNMKIGIFTADKQTVRQMDATNADVENHRSHVVLYFDKALEAATQGGLQPGQCSWQDRALRSEEPTRMTYTINDPIYPNVIFRAADNQVVDMDIFNNRGNRGSSAEKLVDMARSDKTFFIHAFRRGDEQNFTVTKIGL